jgi:hypothetical protein
VRIAGSGVLEHFQAMMIRSDILASLVRGPAGWQEQELIQLQPIAKLVGDQKVPMVDWVKRSAENPKFLCGHTGSLPGRIGCHGNAGKIVDTPIETKTGQSCVFGVG